MGKSPKKKKGNVRANVEKLNLATWSNLNTRQFVNIVGSTKVETESRQVTLRMEIEVKKLNEPRNHELD